MAVKVVTFVLVIISWLTVTSGQRGSYAGSRPPNGNKDKYRPTQSPESIQLANRFGVDNLANGVSQRPPQGVPVVFAEKVFIPISTDRQSSRDPLITNRINTDVNVNTNNPAGAIAGNQPTRTSGRLPLDAHGDQDLVNHLNRLPIDNRPFWFLNYQAIEAQRNGSIANFGPIASRGSFSGK